jgi:predicted amidohydrolase
MRRLATALLLLLAGPALGLATAAEPLPDGWRPYAVRDEIAPRSWNERGPGDALILGLAGRGDDAVDGRWAREVPVAPGKDYAFRAAYRAERIASTARSVLARVVWLDAAGQPLRPMEYPIAAPSPGPDGGTAVAGVYRVPAGVSRARLELHLRWTADGEVRWKDVDFQESAPPPSRRVKLATVNHRPRGTTSSQESRQRFVPFVEQAAARGADIVCLPEGITAVGNGLSYAQAAEAVPGPTTEFLGDLARRLHVWIVAGLYERSGARLYNTAVLVGRDGKLVGRYRKMSLPDEEIEGGITPGSETPVFETDFGRVGLMICWDSSYPEVARALAAGGAEVILMPIAGGVESLVQARAVENQVHIVASGYDFRSGIFDRRGERIADAKGDPDVLVAEVDLARPTIWPWVGFWGARIGHEAPAWAATSR